MSYSLPIGLLICMVVLLPSCYGRETVSMKNYSLDSSPLSWLNDKKHHYMIEFIKEETNYYYQYYNTQQDKAFIQVKPESPSHGLMIDSQFYSGNNMSLFYFNTEILLTISQKILDSRSNLRDEAKDLFKVKLGNNSLSHYCSLQYNNETACTEFNLNYRKTDGSCNNLINTIEGKSYTPYKRLLFPNYENVVGSIGIGKTPFEYLSKSPNPRKLSTSLVKDIDSTDEMRTMAIAIWTMFIGHDLCHTAISNKLLSSLPIECCQESGWVESPRNTNMFCAPIIIPDDDKFYSPLGRHCMNYVRSAAVMKTDCTFGHREQLNQATHFLDASMIYGSTEKMSMALRTRSRGKLSSYNINNKKDYMPLVFGPKACHTNSGTCFGTGDKRANSHPYLTVMYTVWLREHNRIAEQLSLINSHWRDEKLFQETRKIVTAFIQHITYYEWLPALIGHNNFGIGEEESFKEVKGSDKSHSPSVDPRVSNSFATAILPFSNSMLNDTISLYSEDRVIVNNISLRTYYSKPTEIMNNNNMDNLIRGLTTQNTQKVDMLFSQTLTNYLYSNNSQPEPYGMDIVSLTIQRSRDHGIASYTKFRKFCHLKDIESVQDLAKIMVEGAAEKLLAHYKSWDDIDLFVGALFEKHEEGSMVGPMIKCLIDDQFKRTRLGDQYFYDLPNVFKEDQLLEIEKVTLARILCDNSDNIVAMQKNVFFKTMFSNKLLRCESIPKINLNLWAEKQVRG